jgi:flavin reductase (DIM6/NTAB) family NADH-FMN oxidoreductase RutF
MMRRAKPARMRGALTDFPLSRVYQLIEPGPVVLLTTSHRGHANVMTMSWHMMVEFTPPLIAVIVSEANYSFAALKAARSCVIAIPTRRLARKVVAIGNCSGRGVDKFAAFRLKTAPAKHVAAPLLPDCFANLECEIADTRLVKDYNLFVLRVLKAWKDPAEQNPKTLHHRGYGLFAVDGGMLQLESDKA